jgi:hypothetical protein
LSPVQFSQSPQQSSRRCLPFVAACSVVVAALVTGASNAHATCGDYLYGHQSMQASIVFSDDVNSTLHRSTSDENPVTEDGLTTDRFRCPCRGLACKKAPVKSPLPTSGVPVQLKDQFLEEWVFELALLRQISEFPRQSEFVDLPMFVFRMDRPPKA